MGDEADKIIYSMVGVSKSHEKKQILKDIYLSYFYGAKIGVLGASGYTGAELIRMLLRHPRSELVLLTAEGQTVTFNISPGQIAAMATLTAYGGLCARAGRLMN